MTRTLDRSPYYAEYYEHLDRVLNRPQLAGIGISGCVGAGIFVTYGSFLSINGSIGGVLGYIVAGGIVACVLYTLTEMVACRPLTGSLIDLPHTFLDPAYGFAVAASYALANICSMATLTALSAELTATLNDPPRKHSVQTEVGINILFIGLTTVSHCLGVKLYGRIERVIMWFKLGLFVLCLILMLVVNVGGAGLRPKPYNKYYTDDAFTPGWKPIGFDSTVPTMLRMSGVDDYHFGIPGAGGRFFAFLTTMSVTMFSVMGGEMVAMTAGEAKEPWKDVPTVISFVYLVPLCLYPLLALSVGANVNYANPNLAKLWARGSTSGDLPMSPFVIAIQETSLHGLPKALNLFFVISAYTAANTATYVASRAVFMLAQQYLSRRLANIFGRTNNGHTPLYAIGLCSALGLLSLVGLSQYAYSQPRITLSEFYTGTVACVYICLCFTFLRFKAGLDRLGQRRILKRNDPLYITRLFKSRWQPLPAYIGIVGCFFVVVWSGIPPLVILIARGSLTSSENLKSTSALAFDVIGAYIGPIVFMTLYLTYKYVTPRSSRVDIRDLTPGHYVLDDLELIENHQTNDSAGAPGDGNMRTDTIPNVSELESPCETRFSLGQLPNDRPQVPEDVSIEMQEEMEAQKARREERLRIQEILKKRPKWLARGFWRELWGFVVAD